jgi:Fanconi anemia group M protein
MKPKEEIQVLADNREANSLIIRYLSELGTSVKSSNLEIGDYIASDRVGIERKRISDFLQSITDQRIFRQLSDLREAFECPILMIEGNPELLFLEREIHKNTIRGVLAHIAVDMKVPIIWTQNSRESASQIFWIARREQVLEKKPLQIRPSRKARTHAQRQEFLVAGLPHVNTVLSKRLLGELKTIKGIFTASQERLKMIEGLGEEKARKIWELINRKYKK